MLRSADSCDTGVDIVVLDIALTHGVAMARYMAPCTHQHSAIAFDDEQPQLLQRVGVAKVSKHAKPVREAGSSQPGM